MTVIPDTNVFVKARFDLTRPEFRLLSYAVENMEISLYLPEVLVLEIENKYEEVLRSSFQTLVEARRKFKNVYLSPACDTPDEKQIQTAITKFKKEFSEWRSRLKCVERKIDETSASTLVKRDLKRMKPFRDGRGMRDALIWEATMSATEESADAVILISSNTKDFGNAAGDGLHDDLIAELAERDMKDEVTLMPNLTTFVDTHVRPGLAEVELDRIKAWDSEFDPAKLIEEHRAEVDQAIEESLSEILPGEFTSPSGSYFDPDDVRIIDAVEVGSGSFEVRFQGTSMMEINGYVHHSEVFEIEDDFAASVADWDHNEHYAWMQITDDATLKMSATFDVATGKVTGFQVDEVSWAAIQPKEV